MDKETGPQRLFWGDVHNHNEVGYGKGSLERSYEIARASQLDFYAFTPHAWWPDLPEDDPAVAKRHRDGFDLVQREWAAVLAKANAENAPGEFAAFCAFEWHSSRYGDYHVLLPGGSGAICRAADVGELQAYARRTGALMIPHHLGYREGWRGANWGSWRADVSPVADGFSEHGNGIEADTHLAMVTHSMGGVERSQTLLEQWKRGGIVGVTGSSDNHWGYPGSYGEGLTGVWAGGLTREEIFAALRARHTFAVSGDRIEARLECGDGMMGDILPPESQRKLRWKARGWAELAGCEIWKNGLPWRRWFPSAQTEGTEFLLRLEFGWDGMNSQEVTDWQIALEVTDGEIVSVMPAFCGGGGSVEKINRLTESTPSRLNLSAFTSRANSRPTSAVALRVRGSAKTRLRLEAAAGKGGCSLEGSLASLQTRTEWGAVSGIFSAPRISLGSAVPAAMAEGDAVFEDTETGRDDFYFLKVQQCNGQCAWTSPLWFTERTP